ncbi:TetR/AcrR family transcriptional regulator [Winogradskyella arenosi]|uniref:TetR family transcriptional regulator n=1 Tax=Winogradskyella arenosi TaxID=533325 RepID=A0A368ZBN8_9FLAO|nr:TetR/AcrR family transcriptional regulator [Winogradskyella arenosi]RCW90278.1 TetR family transcriptional regulator [Winogradskyella arenosi]
MLNSIIPIFKNYGVRSTTMADISNHLGISKKTLYVHYKSKEDLVEKSVDFIFEGHHAVFNKILNREISPLKKVILMYRYGIRQLSTNSTTFYIELKKYYPKAFKRYQHERDYVTFTIVLNLLKEAQKSGDIVASVDLRLFCLLNIYKIDVLLLNRELTQEYTLAQIVDHLVVFNLKGILEAKRKL